MSSKSPEATTHSDIPEAHAEDTSPLQPIPDTMRTISTPGLTGKGPGDFYHPTAGETYRKIVLARENPPRMRRDRWGNWQRI